MGSSPDVIAVVFDFDDTLVPDSTTKLLQVHGIDTRRFWGEEVGRLVKAGYDPAIAWLNLVLDRTGPGQPLGSLTNNELRKFGASLDGDFFQGLPKMFDDLQEVARAVRDVSVEFYIVTGGLQELVEGSAVVQKFFTAVYGSRLAGTEGKDEEILSRIKRCVTFTEKTRYLFEINKGIHPRESKENPFLVNRDIAEEKRRVPFRNMIYVGDGMTDIPCFSLLNKMGGMGFGVFNPADKEKAKRALLEFLEPKRVIGMHAARYGPDDELGSLLRAAVGTIASRIGIRRAQAEGMRGS